MRARNGPGDASQLSVAAAQRVLGMQAGATAADAKRAYFRLARQCHPDVRGSAAAPGAAEPAEAREHDTATSQRFTEVRALCLRASTLVAD